MTLRPADAWVAIVTLLALLLYFWTGFEVGRARSRHGVPAPAMSGHPYFERAMRVQLNTLEWLAIFLPALWLFAAYADPRPGAAIGAVWILGRYLYMRGYLKDASKRESGFIIQALATAILWVGALVGAVLSLARG